MENHLYICQYCSKEYKPNRRQKQKYCSNSCRTRAFTIRKFKGVNKPAQENKNAQEKKSETMSWAGVGNAAAGTAAVNLASHLFTRDENKPATKKDIKEIKQLFITQHHHIKNMPDRYDGARPFYDLQTKNLVYLIKPMSHGPKKY
ncbi:MAG: Fe-S-cluster-containing dehydrogenase component [Flavobacteriales bacterium]|jgi:Fe-S-cluster-containing dehydrogenase component